MQVPGLPVTVILDREGREIARMMGGADWSSPSALAIVDYLVAHDADRAAAGELTPHRAPATAPGLPKVFIRP